MGSIKERLWLLKKLAGRTSVQGSGKYYRFCSVPGLSAVKNWVSIYIYEESGNPRHTFLATQTSLDGVNERGFQDES